MAIWHDNGFNYARVRRVFNLSPTPIIQAAKNASAILAIALLIFFSNISISNAQVNIPTKPIEVDLFVDGLNLLRPEALLAKSLKNGGKTSLTIENRPSGEMKIKSVKQLPITRTVTQPDGSVKELLDPSVQFETDILITLTGKAQIKNSGAAIGESSVKIGSPAKIEGFDYDINATIVDLRLQE